MKKQLVLIPLCAALLCFSACSDDSAAERERLERSDTLFAEAMSAESRGDAAGAEMLYRQILTRNAEMASAHLNLATLLHDVRKDYIGAIHHYRTYLNLQPTSEKAGIVEERITAARGLLSVQLAAETIARDHRELTADRDGLRAQITVLERNIADLKNALSKKDDEIKDLKATISRLETMLNALRETEAENKANYEAELNAARRAVEETKLRIEDEAADEEIAAVRADILRMIEEKDGGQSLINETTKIVTEGVDDEKGLAATPTSGKSYVVRPGDTLSQISREAYGKAADWTRIRDANRSTTNPDGRLRAGDTIFIP